MIIEAKQFAFAQRFGDYAAAETDRAPLFGGTALLYMVIEHFKNQDPVPVYRRFRDRGRLAPEELQYISSWVDEKLERCFQLMEAANRKHLDE